VVVGFIFIDVMNMVTFRNFAVVISPNSTMNRSVGGIMPAAILPVNYPAEFLMSFVDDFNLWRLV